jgi:hypothetical protein
MQLVSTKKIKMKFYPLFTVITLIFFSCTKENSNEFVTDPGSPYNDTSWVKTISATAPVNEIFQVLSSPSEDSSFDATNGRMINFSNNVQMTFPANGFNAGGNAKAQIIFLKTKGDMIRFGKPTTSGDKFLISGGAFLINVTGNNQSLSLQQNKQITIRYTALHIDPQMTLFYGDTTVNSTDGFTWVASPDTLTTKPITPWYQRQDSGYLYGYQILSKKCRWINCDHYADFNGLTRTKVFSTLPANFTNENTAVFLVFKDIFSVGRMLGDADNHLFYTKDVPVGKDVTIVSISKIGEDFYLDQKQMTVTENINVKLSPEKKTQQEITDYLDSL